MNMTNIDEGFLQYVFIVHVSTYEVEIALYDITNIGTIEKYVECKPTDMLNENTLLINVHQKVGIFYHENEIKFIDMDMGDIADNGDTIHDIINGSNDIHVYEVIKFLQEM